MPASRPPVRITRVEASSPKASLSTNSAAFWTPWSEANTSDDAAAPIQGLAVSLNRPGVSGDSKPWEGWSHVREHVEEVSG